MLEVVFVVDLQHLVDQVWHVVLGHRVVDGMQESRVLHEFGHLGLEDRIVIRRYVTVVYFLGTHKCLRICLGHVPAEAAAVELFNIITTRRAFCCARR